MNDDKLNEVLYEELSEEQASAIAALLNAKNKKKLLNRIDVPAEIANDPGYVGPIYGYLREDTGFHVILGWKDHPADEALHTQEIGAVGMPVEEGVFGFFEDSKIRFVWKRDGTETPLKKNVYTLHQNIFSRNAGLLESAYLADCYAIFAGVGSVGSTILLMLARAGVGHFVLIDPDLLEIHNICRHMGDLSEVGRYKVDVMEERIHRINPSAEVIKYRDLVQNVDFDTLADKLPKNKTVLFSGCDKHEGNASACDVAQELGIPFLAVALFSMAWGFFLYYYCPQLGDIGYRRGMAEALKNEHEREIEAIERNDMQTVNHVYASAEDVEKYNFQPGVGSDVEYACSVAVKLGLDLLCIEDDNYILRLLPYLHQYTQYVLNRDPRLGGGSNLDCFANKPFQYFTIPVEGSEVHKAMVENRKKRAGQNGSEA